MPTSVQNLIIDGEFDKVVDYYSEMLENDPMNPESTGGYFVAKYWANRQDLIAVQSEGKHRATYLMEEWESFEQELDRRGIAGLGIVTHYMKVIFRLAAQNLKFVFQHEGSKSVAKETLVKLGFCLLRCRDYKNAVDILEYSRSQHGGDGLSYFYLAEAAYRTGDSDRSKMYYRDALLDDGLELDTNMIEADFMQNLLLEIRGLHRDDDLFREMLPDWLFIYGSATKVLDVMRGLKDKELRSLFEEVAYLEEQYNKIDETIREKVRIYLIKKYMFLMDLFDSTHKDAGYFSEYGDRLKLLDESIYKLYMENRPRRF